MDQIIWKGNIKESQTLMDCGTIRYIIIKTQLATVK